MKLIKTLAFCALGATVLASCAASVSPAATKTKLEGRGLSVSIYSATDYQSLPTARSLPAGNGFQNYLTAGKTNPEEVLFAWFFDSVGNCDAWFEKNTTLLVTVLDNPSSENIGLGMHNNVAWVGTNDVAIALGWKHA